MIVSFVPEQCGSTGSVIGIGGIWFAATVVGALDEHIPELTVTVYIPDAAVVTLLMVGFCRAEINPPGPVQP